MARVSTHRRYVALQLAVTKPTAFSARSLESSASMISMLGRVVGRVIMRRGSSARPTVRTAPPSRDGDARRSRYRRGAGNRCGPVSAVPAFSRRSRLASSSRPTSKESGVNPSNPGARAGGRDRVGLARVRMTEHAQVRGALHCPSARLVSCARTDLGKRQLQRRQRVVARQLRVPVWSA